jgi:hypothetical protein
VDVLQRRLTKLRGKEREARDAVTELGRDIGDVEKRLTYAKQNPDLPPVQTADGYSEATTTLPGGKP